MDYRGYNDYELLHQIKENDEYALNIMYAKYQPLIISRVTSFCHNSLWYDEMIQEGYLMLHKAIETYDDQYGKSFTRYFEVILVNRLISLTRRNKIKLYLFDEDQIVEDSNIFEENLLRLEKEKKENLFKSSIEKAVYKWYFVENCSIEYIAKKEKITTEQVYYAIRRIRKKINK